MVTLPAWKATYCTCYTPSTESYIFYMLNSQHGKLHILHVKLPTMEIYIIFYMCFYLFYCFVSARTCSQQFCSIFYLFLAHLAFRSGELLSSLFVRRLSSVVHPSTFHILIFSSETTGPIATKLWWNGPWMAPFQNFVR